LCSPPGIHVQGPEAREPCTAESKGHKQKQKAKKSAKVKSKSKSKSKKQELFTTEVTEVTEVTRNTESIVTCNGIEVIIIRVFTCAT
jgi:hypothetical protein